MDAFKGLPEWYCWQRIFELCHVIVISRPGAEMPEFSAQREIAARVSDDPKCLRQRPVGQILLQSVTQLDISASLIRQHLSSRQSIQFLLPETVREKLEQAYVR
jgi:nicotinate-nucleotide adenylyltransferase